MTFLEAREFIERTLHFMVVEEEKSIITVRGSTLYGRMLVLYDKTKDTYDTVGFESFKTHRLYQPWKEMIDAWKKEKQNETSN